MGIPRKMRRATAPRQKVTNLSEYRSIWAGTWRVKCFWHTRILSSQVGDGRELKGRRQLHLFRSL